MRMKTHFKPSLWSALALLALAPSVRAQATKPNFSSKKHGFSLYLPQKPAASTRPKPAMLGGGKVETFATPMTPVSYSIVPIVLPDAAKGLSQKLYFDSVQTGILQSSKGKAVSSKTLKVGGQTARDFHYSFATPTATSKTPVKFLGQTRIYKLGARTYQFTAIAPAADFAKNRAQTAKVFGSIQIAK